MHQSNQRMPPIRGGRWPLVKPNPNLIRTHPLNDNMPRTPIIGGNWKANGSRQEIATLCCTLNGGTTQEGVEVFCAVPALYIDYTKAFLRPDFAISAQNCWSGAVPPSLNGPRSLLEAFAPAPHDCCALCAGWRCRQCCI